MEANKTVEDSEDAACLPAPPMSDSGVAYDRADYAVARPSPVGGSADDDIAEEDVDLEDHPDGYDHRRDIYSGGREASLNPLSAYHLATHTPHLKNCPVCVQTNTKN